MGDTIQFVDTISSSPTVRLDLNDEATFWVKKFDAPPPRLRRSVASNAMRDGISVGSSSYEGRTLIIELECRKSTQDLVAVEIQKLWRELDRSNNWIKYQPTGATKPVFFRTFRSDTSALADVMAQAAMRTFTIEVLAEPAALGLPETLGSYTVTNDPAAGSNGCYFDVTGVIGDIEAPALFHDSTRTVGHGILSTRQRGTPSDLVWFKQCEGTNVSLGADTTNPGGGPDAAMSGTGTNNYVRTSFSTTAGDAERLFWNMAADYTTAAQRSAIRGTYRAVAVVRRSDSTSVINIRRLYGAPAVAVPQITGRQMVDLGLASIGSSQPTSVGYGAEGAATVPEGLHFYAQRVSGSGTLDWDQLLLIPADERMVQWQQGLNVGTSLDTLVDGVRDVVAVLDPSTGPLHASPWLWPSLITASGSWPTLAPNRTNRVFFLQAAAIGGVMTRGHTSSMTVYYWPRYLHVRPAST